MSGTVPQAFTPLPRERAVSAGNPGRKRLFVALAVVGGLHVGLFALLSLSRASAPVMSPPAFDVVLLAPPLRLEPPPPPVDPAPTQGGGAPAAPSRIHSPPEPVKAPPELPAPVVQAPEPPIVVGIAPSADPDPGFGQGGQGTGTGTGVGEGDGPGSGGMGARLITGPTRAQILREYPREAQRSRRSGRAAIRCMIRLDTRLEDCRVVDETPIGMAFGEAALRAAVHYRFLPPTQDGRPRAGQPVTFIVLFGPQ